MADDNGIKKSIDILNEKQDIQTEKLIDLSETSIRHSVFLDLYKQNIYEINGSLKEISKSLIVNNTILEKQEEGLAEHIRRTDLLEEKISPVEKHVHAVNTIAKVIVGAITIVGTIIGIIKALNL